MPQTVGHAEPGAEVGVARQVEVAFEFAGRFIHTREPAAGNLLAGITSICTVAAAKSGSLLTVTLYLPGGIESKRYSPIASETACLINAVSVLVSTMSAPGTTASFGSSTRPVTVLVTV